MTYVFKNFVTYQLKRDNSQYTILKQLIQVILKRIMQQHKQHEKYIDQLKLMSIKVKFQTSNYITSQTNSRCYLNIIINKVLPFKKMIKITRKQRILLDCVASGE